MRVLASALLLFSLPRGADAVSFALLIRPLGYSMETSAFEPTDKPEDGVRIASIAGAAVLNPATPVTNVGVRPGRFWSKTPALAGATFRVLATAYSSTTDQTDASPFTTASGSQVHDGTIAANFLTFGTRVRFSDYRPDTVFVVEDRHHPRLSDRVDIWFPSRVEAIRFGARVLRMEVVE